MQRLGIPALAVVMIVGTGVAQGVLTDRWCVSPAIAEAVARLDRIPQAAGDWEGETVTMRGSEEAGIAGHICRRYVNRRTSEAVTLFLVCGRPGPISIHTPDVCYGACGFTIGMPSKFRDGDNEFWTVDMVRKRASERTRMRAFWAWSATAGEWAAADNPRLHFASAAVLFKVYFLHELTGVADASAERDPAVDLMHQLLPGIQATLTSDMNRSS